MTCRLLVVRDGLADIIDYWVQTRPDCLEMAWLHRWSGAWVWMEAWK